MSWSGIRDLTGQRFGRLVALYRIESKTLPCGQKQSIWMCKCDCGNIKSYTLPNLTSGVTRSCGCYNAEKIHGSYPIHGQSRTLLYDTYYSMRKRCYLPSNASYKHYGGRGIKVCDEWLNDYMCFYNWALNNGYKEGLSLDRIDCNGDYEPQNCRWVTMKVQQNNKRNNVKYEYEGELKTLSELADEFGLKYTTLRRRVKDYGWDLETALKTPVKGKSVA